MAYGDGTIGGVMATIREVENAIKSLVVQAVYPNGTSSPSITGSLVKIRVGYPISEKLDADVLAGNSQITIFPIGNSDQNTTRFPRIWHETQRNLATLTTSVNANEITIGGIVTVPQAILVTFNRVDYGYVVQADDTLETIATNIAALIPGASAAGNVITLTNLSTVRAVVVVSGKITKELERQWKLFFISVFTPNPDFRETLSEAIRIKIAEAIWLSLPNNTNATIFFKGANEQDIFEKNIIYQRDLVYRVEYPTTITQETTAVQSIEINVN